MTYSIIGILAAIVLLIINHDAFRLRGTQDDEPTRRTYRFFLIGVLVYYISDACWGVLAENHLTALAYVDTVIYFVTMAFSVLLWTRYVVSYLEQPGIFGKALYFGGYVFLAFEIIALVVNFFFPIVFWFDAAGAYHAGAARYVTLGAQILMFLLASGYTLSAASRSEGGTHRRYLTIGMFGIVMIIAIAMQIAFPLWPFYAMGCMIGTCVLHAFVVEDEKAEHSRALEDMIQRGKQQEEELDSTRLLAYTDSLTGVKNTHAYVHAVGHLDRRIVTGEVGEFAVAVFDLNDLKITNDTMGHEAGDQLLSSASKLICNCFDHSPVFRIGGDEFVAILEGRDFANRYDLIDQFEWQVEVNLRIGQVVVASGMAEFDPVDDNAFHIVFERADAKMYLRKEALKNMKAELAASQAK